MVKDKRIELALEDAWFNPAYCCSGCANLLHTCNPPGARTLSYSVLFICALPGRERLHRYPACMCVYALSSVYVEGSDSLHQWLSECLPEVIGQILQ